MTSVVEKEPAIDNPEPHKQKKSQQRKRDTIRTISMRLNDIEENGRKRISRQLHDQVGQDLTALNINLDIVMSLLKEGKTDLSLRRLEDSARIARQTTEHIRHLMTDLRPPVLDDFGLLATLRWYADQFSQRTGLQVIISGSEPFPELSTSLAMPLFRITQEALDNAARHAQAHRVSIELLEKKQHIRLSIADDGIGFKPDQIKQPRGNSGWGLWIMQQRAESIGGKFRIHSQPGKGTNLSIEVRR
jgi:signal transduction histidine kinase